MFPFFKNQHITFSLNKPYYYMDANKNITRLGNCTWISTLPPIGTYKVAINKEYCKENYIYYNNYNAIEVSKIKDIPRDYEGIMGVPITIMLLFNPEQFEILGTSWDKDNNLEPYGNQPFVKGKETYRRIFIKNKNPN